MAYGQIPRGLDDLGVYVLTADTPGAKVDVPGVRSLSVSVESDSDQLEGDNSVIAIARNPKSLSGSIEIGMINLAALAALNGGTVVTTGTSGEHIMSLDESSAAPARYVQIVGQAGSLDENGSAYRITLLKCQVVSGPNETLTVNDWNTPTIDFEGVAIGGVLLTRENFETAEPLAA